jgi:hypothetical protein
MMAKGQKRGNREAKKPKTAKPKKAKAPLVEHRIAGTPLTAAPERVVKRPTKSK